MTQPYSEDLRERALARYEAGECQTAWNVDPGSASKIDPLDGCVVTPLVSPAERIEVAQPG
jgi:hypothetical protein